MEKIGREIFKFLLFFFKIDKTIKRNRFNERIISEFNIVYLVNATDLMGSYLAARDQCINISKQLKVELPEFDFNFWSFIL